MIDFPLNWESRIGKDFDRELLSKLNYSQILIKLLALRGIITKSDIKSFLKPSLKSLNDPMTLPGMERALKRVKDAIDKKENILIFGDYDADGIISSSLIYNFLKILNLPVDIYIPDRFKEGYGLNLEFIKKVIAKKSATLLISVDCGTNDLDVMEYLQANKPEIDIIVCDHHKPSFKKEKRSDNYIIINPRLAGSKYPWSSRRPVCALQIFQINPLKSLNSQINQKKWYFSPIL